jgi:hypothetical protein
MDLLDTQINPADVEFRGNASRMESLVAELRAQLTHARAGGGDRPSSVTANKANCRRGTHQPTADPVLLLELSALAPGRYDKEALVPDW